MQTCLESSTRRIRPENFYDRIIEIDLDALEPYLNGPFTPDAAVAEKGCEKEFAFLELLEQRAIECFKRVKGTKKQVCPRKFIPRCLPWPVLWDGRHTVLKS